MACNASGIFKYLRSPMFGGLCMVMSIYMYYIYLGNYIDGYGWQAPSRAVSNGDKHEAKYYRRIYLTL